MTNHVFICTRQKCLSETTTRLADYFKSAGWKVKFLINEDSIFEAYSKAFESTEKNDLDNYILCHDDIEIFTEPKVFNRIIFNHTLRPERGFLGVAGTTFLSEDAVWWNQEAWRRGLHSGSVFHGEDILTAKETYYGPPRQVVVLDGLFLAASGKTLKEIGLEKPEYFSGNWDFYDLHYTVKAHQKKLQNFVAPIQILHNSEGSLVGRDSWTANRQEFINNTRLPIFIR